MMFSIGNRYDLEINEGVDLDGNTVINTIPGVKVVDVQLPLIKINRNGGEEIINTGSNVFVRARLVS